MLNEAGWRSPVDGTDRDHPRIGGGPVARRLPVIAARRDQDAAARQRVIDDVGMRLRAARRQRRIVGAEAHVDHLGAEIDGELDRHVEVADRAEPDRGQLAGEARSRERAHRDDPAGAAEPAGHLPALGGDDAGTAHAMTDEPVFGIGVVAAVVAEQLDAGRDIARFEPDGVVAGAEGARELGMVLADSAVDQADHDSVVARLDRMRLEQPDQSSRRPAVVAAPISAMRTGAGMSNGVSDM